MEINRGKDFKKFSEQAQGETPGKAYRINLRRRF